MQNQPNNAVSTAIFTDRVLISQSFFATEKNVQKSPGELSLSKGFPGVRCYDLVGSNVMPIAI